MHLALSSRGIGGKMERGVGSAEKRRDLSLKENHAGASLFSEIGQSEEIPETNERWHHCLLL